MSGIRKPTLTLATAQSVVTADVKANGVEIRRLMRAARAQGADIVHFPESAMSGCAKAHIKRWSDVDWPALESDPAQLSQPMSSRLVGPSGSIQAACEANVSTLTVNVLDEDAPEWNVALHCARPWRAKAREGEIYRRLHVVDPRSKDRSRF